MSQESLSNFINHLMRGGNNIAPLIQEYSLTEILNQLADYASKENICSSFAGDKETTERWRLTKGLLEKAASLWVPQTTPEPIDAFHREAINRFYAKLLPDAQEALGSPPQLSIEVTPGSVTPAGAEFYNGWYEPWDTTLDAALVIKAHSYDHCLALKLGLEEYKKTARGLFRVISFESGGCCRFVAGVADS
jgi:hypothetical protein